MCTGKLLATYTIKKEKKKDKDQQLIGIIVFTPFFNFVNSIVL